MSKKEYISIQDAAEISNKSAQTIRRAIKAKKITFRKSKTPQGFNYLISRTSLIELYKLKITEPTTATAPVAEEPKAAAPIVEEKIQEVKSDVETMTVDVNDFKTFVTTLDSLIQKHSEERQSFLRLVDTMQEKIFVLENQINLLSAPKKKWYQWK
jgi:hypothetical protein